jgi:hypothetical protein
MVLKAKILAWLMALPWTAHDRATETLEARQVRMSDIAESVVKVSRGDRQKSAFLLVQAKHESDFDWGIQACECGPHQCDPGRVDGELVARAHGPFQIHYVHSIAFWWSACGVSSEAFEVGAQFTLGRYRADNLECSYARLERASTPCNAPWAVARATEARRLAGRL